MNAQGWRRPVPGDRRAEGPPGGWRASRPGCRWRRSPRRSGRGGCRLRSWRRRRSGAGRCARRGPTGRCARRPGCARHTRGGDGVDGVRPDGPPTSRCARMSWRWCRCCSWACPAGPSTWPGCSPPDADTEVVTSRSVAVEACTSDGGGPRTLVDEVFVRTPNFAPDGSQRPAQMQLHTAVGCYLLARRKPMGHEGPAALVEGAGRPGTATAWSRKCRAALGRSWCASGRVGSRVMNPA